MVSISQSKEKNKKITWSQVSSEFQLTIDHAEPLTKKDRMTLPPFHSVKDYRIDNMYCEF